MIGIYKITSPDFKVYIGQSVDIKARWSQYNSWCNWKLKLSFDKYGIDNHKFEILEECSVENLNERERFYQDKFDVLGENGFNLVLTATKTKQVVYSEEYKKNLSTSNKNREDYELNKSNLHSYRNYGTYFSEEHKLNLSINNCMNKRVIDTVTGEVFRSIKVAADSIGMKPCNLENRLKGSVKNNTNLKYYKE